MLETHHTDLGMEDEMIHLSAQSFETLRRLIKLIHVTDTTWR